MLNTPILLSYCINLPIERMHVPTPYAIRTWCQEFFCLKIRPQSNIHYCITAEVFLLLLLPIQFESLHKLEYLWWLHRIYFSLVYNVFAKMITTDFYDCGAGWCQAFLTFIFCLRKPAVCFRHIDVYVYLLRWQCPVRKLVGHVVHFSLDLPSPLQENSLRGMVWAAFACL